MYLESGLDARALLPEQYVLLRAAELLRRGWIQGVFFDNAGRYCILGAINQASRELGLNSIRTLPVRTLAQRRVLRVIVETPCDIDAHWAPMDEISVWNDEPGRTKDEVLAVVEKAAELEEKAYAV